MTAVPAAPLRPEVERLLDHGSVHTSPGGQYSFRVIGPCCRLYDREELPWPCCRLAWRSKEPSWRRVGRRFVADLGSRRCPSYSVELLQPGSRPTVTVLTLSPCASRLRCRSGGTAVDLDPWIRAILLPEGPHVVQSVQLIDPALTGSIHVNQK